MGPKKIIVFTIIILVVGYFVYRNYSSSPSQTTYVLGKVTKQTIITSVSGTGQVSQDRTVNINPTSSGKLVSVNVKQGDQVKAGQTIATVDETNNTISLNQAKASLASAQASYDQTLAGATSQDIQLSQLTVDSDQKALDNAKANFDTVTKQQAQAVSNAFTNYMNAGLQAIPQSGNSSNVGITISGTYTGTDQGSYTITVTNTGLGQQFGFTGLETGSALVSKTSPTALGKKGLYIQFTGTPNNNDGWIIAIPNTLSASYSSSYNSYQNSLTAQSSALASAQNQIDSAQNRLDQDKINLQVKQQPPTNQQLESAKAQLTQAQASFENAQIAFNNNILKAPFDGTVAQLNSQTGDQVSASTNVAVVVSSQSIAIIPLNEVDVASVKLGDKATMTFNAVDGLVMTGKVVQIDNIGTVSQGVVSYNVKIAFDTEDPRIKPGMSVNVSVITHIAPDVLTVPSSAVQTQSGSTYVLKLDPAQTQTVTGQTGVTAKTPPTKTTVQIGTSDGTNTEITNGLNEGDSIVVQTITLTTTKSAASSATSALRIGGGGGAGGFGGGGATRPATTGTTGR